jgi:hypothetical protein
VEASEVRSILVAAYPALADPLAEIDANPITQGLHYPEMAAVARHLGVKLKQGETAGFPEFFNAVESCLRGGSADAIELTVVGLLEDLQNGNITGVEDYSRWEEWLEPEAREAWAALTHMWNGDKVALQTYLDRGSPA